MSNDFRYDEAVEEFEEKQRAQQAREAAALVLGGADRHSAVKAIKDLYALRADASEGEVLRDHNGHISEYLTDDMASGTGDGNQYKSAQINAIAAELLPLFE